LKTEAEMFEALDNEEWVNKVSIFFMVTAQRFRSNTTSTYDSRESDNPTTILSETHRIKTGFKGYE
jgi:hypothetical protein